MDTPYEVVREGEEIILRVDFSSVALPPTIEDDSRSMERIITYLQEIRTATKVIINQGRDYEYDYDQTQMLLEICRVQNALVSHKALLSQTGISDQSTYVAKLLSSYYIQLQNLLFQTLKGDPIGTYVELKRLLRNSQVKLQSTFDADLQNAEQTYIQALQLITESLEQTKLITLARPYLAGYDTSTRDLYRQFLTPLIRPDFMLTKLMAMFPKDAQEVDSFTIGETQVTIFKVADNVQYLYHIMPPEFRLTDEQYSLLDEARTILAEHKPQKSEFTDPERMREVFSNVGLDLLTELANKRGLSLRKKELESLTKILVRYTVGFGLIEVLLEDEDMQDISVNSPQGSTQIFIVHGKYDECMTNIMPTKAEAESWATKLRLISGRSLDEADPILDTELMFTNASVRVSAITFPLNPTGLAFSFRRHRDKPWTLPLFIKYKTINPMAAGLLSFLIDGSRAILIAGTRSSGKSSLLSSVMVEIMRRYRIITIEDTLELPVKQLRNLGYNIQQMKVASALGAKTNEMDASDGIRSTLRLGDSALFVGEVRSGEAKALYEAMRVGAAANVVAGTIHGDSPYGVFDRVVNDIGVPKTSFKATDIIIVANPIRSADGLHKFRRVLSITEVRKDWTDDPAAEHGFVDLMKYNPVTDELEVTDALISGDSDVLKTIAGNIKEFAGNWDAVWQNVLLRAKIKEMIVKAAEVYSDPEVLEAPFVIACNDQFHRLYEDIRATGKKESFNDDLFASWSAWLEREMRKRRIAKGQVTLSRLEELE
ncbi:MAG TPA: type II/IV secretion system ATPase subunit [Acidobacteriota bacterium]|nr:type II/IV secretion system ATPase subunit [Acidobacteriota bacterium]